MFYPRRVVDVPDGKPKWTGINESSELMEEGKSDLPHPKKRRTEESDEDGNEKGSK